MVGKSVKINCSVSRPQWLKDDSDLPIGVTLIYDFMIIHEVWLIHHGEYTCVDQMNNLRATSMLYVGGKMLY